MLSDQWLAASRELRQQLWLLFFVQNGRASEWHLREPDRTNTPLAGWPNGDGPENYRYSSAAPPIEDDGAVPPLMLRARQMGLDV